MLMMTSLIRLVRYSSASSKRKPSASIASTILFAFSLIGIRLLMLVIWFALFFSAVVMALCFLGTGFPGPLVIVKVEFLPLLLFLRGSVRMCLCKPGSLLGSCRCKGQLQILPLCLGRLRPGRWHSIHRLPCLRSRFFLWLCRFSWCSVFRCLFGKDKQFRPPKSSFF